MVELGCISEQRDPTAALASPPPAPQEKSDLEKCTHVKSNPLQFGGLFVYDEGERVGVGGGAHAIFAESVSTWCLPQAVPADGETGSGG